MILIVGAWKEHRGHFFSTKLMAIANNSTRWLSRHMYSEHARTFKTPRVVDHVIAHVTVHFKRAPLPVSAQFTSDGDMDASSLKKLHVKEFSTFLCGKGIPGEFCKAFEGIR